MKNPANKSIHLAYYALLRDERGIDEETVQTNAHTAHELYQELKKQHNFRLSIESLKVSINDTMTSWQTELKNGDQVVFIPPVSGG